MLLSKILGCESDKNDCEIREIRRNAKMIQQGDIFFCFSKDERIAFARCQEAKMRGAKRIFCEFEFSSCTKVEDVRALFAKSCANFYDRACDKLKIIGVSGTNGKTTTCHIIAEMLKRNGFSVGVIGTSGVFFNGKSFESPLTTPDADFLHKTFKQMVEDDVQFVVMEVSAHAIDQRRIDDIQFEIGVLTNITQDHLDYFGTMEKYEQTKISFFNHNHIKKAIVCIDDERIEQALKFIDVPTITYGIKNPCDSFAIDALCEIYGSSFLANVCDSVLEIKTNLIGGYNIYNSLAALSVCKELGMRDEQLRRGINFINPVEGRFNVFNVEGKYVVVDYAHTPDGLEQVINTAKALTDKRVCVVFGCGGNRDASKRPIMGKISEIADVVFLTNDNPRNEDPAEIVKEIESGMTKHHFVEMDRARAIEKAIRLAHVGDIIVVAGKGIEKYQEIGGQKLPYSDFDVISNYCKVQTEERIRYGS